ncbi:MAG: extracellular solute-binding protein [bacterium]|nr:extracellular solute-binding protein [bacterium]
MRPTFDKAVPWRLRFLVAIVATLALVATACGNDDDSDSGDSAPPAPAATGTAADSGDGLSDEEVEIRVAYFNGAGQTEIDFREQQAAEFSAMHPNVTVNMVPVSDWQITILPQIASGDAPDVLWGGTDDGYGQMVGRNAFRSVQPYIDSEGYDLSQWPGGMLAHFSDPDGNLLVLPSSNLSFNFLYYNKNLFDEAGLDYPSDSWSVDDLIDAARALSIPDEQWGFGFAWDDLYQTWMRMYGCEFSDDPTFATDYTYNGPHCAEALEGLDELSREGVINWELGAQWGGLAPGDAVGESAFSAGHVAMLLSGTWEAPTIADNSGGAFEFDAVSAPLADGGTIQGAASGFGVYEGSDNPEWAWEYVKFIAGPEGQEAEANEGIGQSPIARILDQVYCASDAPPINKCAVAKVGAANTIWEPLGDAWVPGFWDVISPAVQGGFTAGSPPDWQAVLDEAVETSRQAAPLS